MNVKQMTLATKFCSAWRMFSRVLMLAILFGVHAIGQETDPKVQKLPDGFKLTELSVKLDSPDRFSMEYAGGILAPTRTSDDGPVFVRGTLTILGSWDDKHVHTDEVSNRPNGEITLVFRAVPLLGVVETFEAVRLNSSLLVTIEEDMDRGRSRMVWHLDKQSPRNRGDQENSTADWRLKKADQEYKLKVPLRVPQTKREIKADVPFEFVWYPDGQWRVDYFYAIDVSHTIGVDLEQTALFHAGARVLEPERELRILVYKVLTSLGVPLDPFWWLK